MTDDGASSRADNRKHPRQALSLLVQYRFDSFEDFLAEYSLDISPGGIFIRTTEPREIGAHIYLQFQLQDGSKLIEGLGRVVWVNPPGSTNRIPGMGIEFVNFDADSMALIESICANKGAAPKSG